MQTNSKLLALLSLLIVIIGFSLLWFGLKPQEVILPELTPTPTIISTTDESTKSATLGIEGKKAVVTKVVDGDTIQIASGQTVRFIGIDTPETVDPRRPVGCFGKEASNEVKNLLSGKEVVLQKDVSDTDKYNRLLRYIYLPIEGGQYLFMNDYLVREGYATVLTYPPDVKYDKQLIDAQRYAKENGKGLWGRC